MTFVRKDMHGNWRASDEIDLGEGRKLTVTTSKLYNGTLCTSASVGHLDGGFITHSMYQDFSMSRIALTKPARCTSKVVEEQHAEVMKDIEAIKSCAVAHYAERVSA